MGCPMPESLDSIGDNGLYTGSEQNWCVFDGCNDVERAVHPASLALPNVFGILGLRGVGAGQQFGVSIDSGEIVVGDDALN